MSARKRNDKGFTLVEILIVVVILGILAAIVIPQFTSASETAKASSLQSQLQTIRSQLELAQIQHQGAYPDLIADGWTVMTGETEPTSDYNTTVDDSGDEVGPYLQKPPVNPFTGSSSVAASAADGVGWVYDATDGSVTAAIPSAKATELGTQLPTADISTF